MGLLIGLATAALLVLSWRLPTTSGTLGADISLASRPTGEFAVEPVGRFVKAAGLRPGSPASSGHVAVTNQTASRMDVSLHLSGESKDLDLLTRVSVSADRDVVFNGTLGDLRRPRPSFVLDPGDIARVDVRVWLPAGIGDGYRGRVEAVTLDFDGTPVGA